MKKNNGFTMVELIVVVGLIAILLTFILSNLNKNRALARDNVRIADIDNIRLALDEYRSYCGVYPSSLQMGTNNGRAGNCDKTFGEFIGQIPTNLTYSTNNQQYYDSNSGPGVSIERYMYFGMAESLAGPCFDYIIGVQLEYGSENDYFNGEHSSNFAKVNQSSLDDNNNDVRYDSACSGSPGDGIPSASDSASGIYGFRSANIQ